MLSAPHRGRGAAALPLLLALLALAGSGDAHAVSRDDGGAGAADVHVLHDDSGHELRLEHAPRRIVSLLPSLTETVCALDACDRLVATDRFSDWPAAVRALPKVGGLDDAEFEMIVRLQPDVILLSRTQRISGRLESLGLKAFALDSESYAAIGRTVTLLGELLGEPERAAALERRIEHEVAEVAERAHVERRGSAPSVYFEVDRTPFAASAASFIGELLERLGAHNIVPADLGPFPKLNPEYVVRRNPDVIIASRADAPHLAERPGWQTIRAVRERHICSIDASERDTIVRPGPRVALGMRVLEDCLERVAPVDGRERRPQ